MPDVTVSSDALAIAELFHLHAPEHRDAVHHVCEAFHGRLPAREYAIDVRSYKVHFADGTIHYRFGEIPIAVQPLLLYCIEKQFERIRPLREFRLRVPWNLSGSDRTLLISENAYSDYTFQLLP